MDVYTIKFEQKKKNPLVNAVAHTAVRSFARGGVYVYKITLMHISTSLIGNSGLHCPTNYE